MLLVEKVSNRMRLRSRTMVVNWAGLFFVIWVICLDVIISLEIHSVNVIRGVLRLSSVMGIQ